MPFEKISSFEKSFPSVKNLSPEEKQKALDIFNAIMRDNPDMDEGEAIATAIKQARGKNLDEMFQPPKGAQQNAKKVLRWKEEHGDEVEGMTAVGWRRARQLASGKKVSRDIVARMAQFARHEKNSTVDPEHKGEPWKDAGRVAWLGWGGDTGINWAKNIMDKKKNMNENIHEHYYYLSDVTDSPKEDVEILRVGKIHSHNITVTEKMLKDFVHNYKENVYGAELQVNEGHNRDGKATGWVKDLYMKGKKLMAKIEWNELGEELIGKKMFRYVSAEFAEKAKHCKTGELVENVLIGIGLTNIPALKNQKPLMLSEDLNNLQSMDMFEKMLKALKGKERVAKQVKELVKEMFEELPEEDKERFKEAVETIMEMPDEGKELEEDKEEMEDKEMEEKEMNEKQNVEKLQEKESELKTKLSESLTRVVELEQKLERKELQEEVEKKYMLSSNNDTAVGFSKESKDKLLDFLVSLSEEQRAQFDQLMGDYKAVQLNTIGSTNTGKRVELSEDNMIELAEKLLNEGKASDIFEAQKLASKELNK